MKERILVGLLSLLISSGFLSSACLGDESHPPTAHGISQWLAHDAFEHWMSLNLQNKPFYITSAEGRLHHGVSEWRVRWTPSPKGVEWYWYWWYDSDATYYASHVQSLVGPKGFDQIWLQSFVNEKGERKYQSIFLKIISHDKGKSSPVELPRLEPVKPATLLPTPASDETPEPPSSID